MARHDGSSKGKGHPVTYQCRYRGEMLVQLYPSPTSALERVGWSTPGLSRFTPARKPGTHFTQGCVSVGLLWMGPESLASIGVRTQDHSAPTVKTAVFWDVTQCGLLKSFQSQRNFIFLHSIIQYFWAYIYRQTVTCFSYTPICDSCRG